MQKGKEIALKRKTVIDDNKELAMRIATIPINLKVEHCTYLRTPANGSRMEPVRRSAMKELYIRTLHAPLQGFHGTTLEGVRKLAQEFYAKESDSFHRGHDHAARNAIIMGEMRFQPWGPDHRESERILTERNWQEALSLLVVDQVKHSRMGKMMRKTRTATIAIAFTCPRAV